MFQRLCRLVVVLLFAISVPLAAGAAPRPADPRPADKAKLDAGDVVVRTYAVKGYEMPRATMYAVIDAPIEKVWAVIDKCSDYKRTMIRVLESEELSRKGNVVTCRIKVDMPWPVDDLKATTRATHTVAPGKRYERAWTMVEGDYKVNDGKWVFTPWGDKPGRTLAYYEVHAVPKVGVPVWIMKKASRSALPDLIERLRKFSGAPPR